ncbi:MAG: MFS transporter [Candidatus Pristimantibacillus lignocellulolyticus]|uniref:MFS transporter n=1 Tax=Candidatus Pristimantibacillus lignocellulolyticus TaxID=2994561 RepID=A0A9J6ZDW8_9BACL|nr:MAG: MFS transporter [Candidatus Pristimantibacillus lignocellulolyticus]
MAIKPGIRNNIIFSFVQLMYCAATAKSVFTVLYLQQKGLSNTIIGLIISISAVIVIFLQPLWGYISDRFNARIPILIACFTMATIMYCMLLTTEVPIILGVILVSVSFFECAIASILDVWILAHVGKNYGSIRLWGSIGFSGAVLIYSQVVGSGTIASMFPVYIIVSILTLIAFFLLIRYAGSNLPIKEERKKLKFSPKLLISNNRYMLLLCFVFMLFLPNSPASTFLPNLFQATGGSVEMYGWSNSFRAAAEIPAFLFGALLLRRFGHVAMIFFASSLYFMSQLLFALAESPLQVALGQIMQGPAYSLLLLGTLNYVYQLAPKDMQVTAQTLVSAIGMGLAAIVGNYSGGLVIDNFGIKPLYWTGMSIIAAAMLLFLLSFMWGKKNNDHKVSIMNATRE